MKYRVIISYQGPTEPMLYADAAQLVAHLRATGLHCHIEEV